MESAREVVATNLGIKSGELEIVGELGYAFELALAGLLAPKWKTDSQEGSAVFSFAPIDRQIVHAFTRAHQAHGGKVNQIRVGEQGLVDYASEEDCDVLSWQSTNRETGVTQADPNSANYQSLFADMSAALPGTKLPEKWDTAVWDPRFFGGPQGIAFIGISQNSKWQKPGADIDKRRVYGSFSKPLFLASAVALENSVQNQKSELEKLAHLNSLACQLLKQELPNVLIAGEDSTRDPRFLAFCLPGSISEEVLRKVEILGFLIDAGSACSSGPLSPSHVLTAMGFPEQGNFRITFRSNQKEEEVAELVKGIAASA